MLTLWRRKKGKGQDTAERDRGRDAHFLETAEGGTSQITERKRPSVRYSRPGDHRGRHKSGHEKEATERRGLTDWRPHRERQVKAQKESDQAERHSRSGDHGGGYKSEHEKEATKRGALTLWRPQEGQFSTWKESH